MAKPVIGLTTGRTNHTDKSVEFGVPEAYIHAVRNAGGVPVMIPLGLGDDDLKILLNRVNGVLFTGGGDIHPPKYQGVSEELVHQVDQDRDNVEIFIAEQATRQKIPFFGICRGLQLINVAMGGTLYEDISEQYSRLIQHDHSSKKNRGYRAHPVAIQPGSKLNQLLATATTDVNSLHHQGIRRLGNGLTASAHAPDGLIEGIELADYPFGIAVQWHPENMPDDKSMLRLFEAFIKASAKLDPQEEDR